MMAKAKSSSKLFREALSPAENPGRELSSATVFFHEAIAAHLGMNAGEWRCYGLLKQHGPTTAGRLAELSGFTTGAITGIADRLEKAGYVQRQPNPDDRRSLILHPLRLEEINAKTGPIFASLGRAMDAVAKNYTAQELAAIMDYFRRTAEVLHKETVKLNEG
jgi:DNA-binding MarR family transcriptional regulator